MRSKHHEEVEKYPSKLLLEKDINILKEERNNYYCLYGCHSQLRQRFDGFGLSSTCLEREGDEFIPHLAALDVTVIVLRFCAHFGERKEKIQV